MWLNDEALDFLVAETFTRLVLLGCGRYKSLLQTIERAFDEGVLDSRGISIDTSVDGYMIHEWQRKDVESRIIEKMCSPLELRRILSDYDIGMPEGLLPLADYLADP